MSSAIEMLALVGPPDVLEGEARERWLDRVRTCRHRLLQTWRRQGELSERAAAAIEQSLELILVCRFIRDRQPAALSHPGIDPPGITSHGYCQILRQTVTSSILQAVLDPADFSNTDPLPQGVMRAVLAADLGWRDRIGRAVPLPPTAFGEFHQLCLSEGDSGKAGQRRNRGVHYRPVSLADYLTARILDQLPASADVQTSLRILEPS